MADETILIIDDSADTRLLLRLRLKAQWYGPSLRAMPWRRSRWPFRRSRMRFS
jgi:hypothetical protein